MHTEPGTLSFAAGDDPLKRRSYPAGDHIRVNRDKPLKIDEIGRSVIKLTQR